MWYCRLRAACFFIYRMPTKTRRKLRIFHAVRNSQCFQKFQPTVCPHCKSGVANWLSLPKQSIMLKRCSSTLLSKFFNNNNNNKGTFEKRERFLKSGASAEKRCDLALRRMLSWMKLKEKSDLAVQNQDYREEKLWSKRFGFFFSKPNHSSCENLLEGWAVPVSRRQQ